MKLAALASATLLLGAFAATSASAQSVGIYVGPGAGYYANDAYYDSDYDYEPAPVYRSPARVYGYVRRDRDPELLGDRATPRSEGNCGTYRYWDGDACVDARTK